MSCYQINIFYSDEDDSYIADVSDLKCCSAFGKTLAKALNVVELAKKDWLAQAKKIGKPILKARYR